MDPVIFDNGRSWSQPDSQLLPPGLTAVHQPLQPPAPHLSNIGRAMHSLEDWKPFEALIRELWIKKNLTLKEVQAVLAEQHGFYTTKRQFDRIAQKWGLRKNVRKGEMMVIVQTQHTRAGEGKKTAVRIHGRELSKFKIARWKQRHKDKKEFLEVDSSAAPSLQYIEFSPRKAEEPVRSRYYLRYGRRDLMDSPNFNLLITMLIEDGEEDCDDIPPLDLDSPSGFSDGDRALGARVATSLEGNTSMVPANTARNTPSLNGWHVQSTYDVFLVSEISPFPSTEPLMTPKILKLSSGLPYKRAEEIMYTSKLKLLKQQTDQDDTPEYLAVLMQLAEVFIMQRNDKDAREIFHFVSQTREKKLGFEHKDTLHAAAWFAQAIYNQGQHSVAEPLIRRVYDVALRVLGPNHDISIATRAMMSNIAWKFGNSQEMKQLAREVLQICLQTYGPKHRDSIIALCQLAKHLDVDEYESLSRTALDICKNGGEGMEEVAISAAREVAMAMRGQDRNEESLELLKDVLNRSRDVYGPNHRFSLQFQAEVGHGLIFVKKFDEAERLSRQTLLQERNVAGFAIYEGLYTLNVYARALESLERYPEAEQRCIRVINELDKLCGKFGYDTVDVIEALADIYEEQERLDDAIALYTEKYREFEEAEIENTPGSRILFSLANALYRAKRFEEAAAYFRKLINLQSKLVGATHKDTLAYYEWLGDCYADRKQWDQQVEVYREKYEELQRSAVENEYTLQIWYQFGTSLYSAQQYVEAEKCFIGLLERQEAVLGIAHKAVIATYESLGDSYHRDGRYNEEIALYQVKLDQLRTLSEKDAFKIWYLLGVALFFASRLEEAEDCFKTLIQRQEAVLGVSHQTTLRSYESLGDCYNKAKRIDDMVAHYQQKNDELLLAGIETERSLRIFFLLAWSLFKAKKYAEARTRFIVLIEKQERILGPTHKDTLSSYEWLTNCYYEEECYEDILSFMAEKVELFRSANADNEHICELLKPMALVLYRAGLSKFASTLFKTIIGCLEAMFGPEHLPALEAKVWLGWCQESRCRYVTALATYEAAIEGLVSLQEAGKKTNERLLKMLGEDIPKMKERVANGEGEEGDDDDDEEEEDDSENDEDVSGSEMAWENYADLDGLEELVPADILMF